MYPRSAVNSRSSELALQYCTTQRTRYDAHWVRVNPLGGGRKQAVRARAAMFCSFWKAAQDSPNPSAAVRDGPRSCQAHESSCASSPESKGPWGARGHGEVGTVDIASGLPLAMTCVTRQAFQRPCRKCCAVLYHFRTSSCLTDPRRTFEIVAMRTTRWCPPSRYAIQRDPSRAEHPTIWGDPDQPK